MYHVTDDLGGKTIAAVVRAGNDGMSWGEANRLVKKRYVEVNGNLACDPARRLNPGEVVKLYPQPRQPLPELDDLSILFRDEHLAVVDKPAKVTSCREPRERGKSGKRKQLQPTLDEMLQGVLDAEWRAEHPEPDKVVRGKWARQARRKGEVEKPKVRPVHRLDRDTSGLMVFALSAEAERDLIEQFRRHVVKREYLALVHGHPEAMTVQSHLVRDRGDGKRGSLPARVSPKSDKTARHAVTHVEPIRPAGEDEQWHLVRCRLETGRTHQIRIHLAEKGHPLVGDRLYGRPDDPAPRQALHAATLALHHPLTGEPIEEQSPWPEDLQWLHRVRV